MRLWLSNDSRLCEISGFTIVVEKIIQSKNNVSFFYNNLGTVLEVLVGRIIRNLKAIRRAL